MASQRFTFTGQTTTPSPVDATKAGSYVRGLKVVLDVTVAPGADTVTVTIEGKDVASGKYFTMLVGTAVSATGTTVLTVYPGIAAAANSAANDVVPDAYRVRITHSGAGAFTYTLGVTELG